jgi:hypothetical protein
MAAPELHRRDVENPVSNLEKASRPRRFSTGKFFPVEDLVAKAAKADKSDDALKFSQAACNAASAMCGLKGALKDSK